MLEHQALPGQEGIHLAWQRHSMEIQLSGLSEPRVELAPCTHAWHWTWCLPSSKARRLHAVKGGFSKSSIPGWPVPLPLYLRCLAGRSLSDSLIKEARDVTGMLWPQLSGGREGMVTLNCNPSSRMTCSQALGGRPNGLVPSVYALALPPLMGGCLHLGLTPLLGERDWGGGTLLPPPLSRKGHSPVIWN